MIYSKLAFVAALASRAPSRASALGDVVDPPQCYNTSAYPDPAQNLTFRHPPSLSIAEDCPADCPGSPAEDAQVLGAQIFVGNGGCDALECTTCGEQVTGTLRLEISSSAKRNVFAYYATLVQKLDPEQCGCEDLGINAPNSCTTSCNDERCKDLTDGLCPVNVTTGECQTDASGDPILGIEGKTTKFYDMGEITWTCGAELELRDQRLIWSNTGANTCANFGCADNCGSTTRRLGMPMRKLQPPCRGEGRDCSVTKVCCDFDTNGNPLQCIEGTCQILESGAGTPTSAPTSAPTSSPTSPTPPQCDFVLPNTNKIGCPEGVIKIEPPPVIGINVQCTDPWFFAPDTNNITVTPTGVDTLANATCVWLSDADGVAPQDDPDCTGIVISGPQGNYTLQVAFDAGDSRCASTKMTTETSTEECCGFDAQCNATLYYEVTPHNGCNRTDIADKFTAFEYVFDEETTIYCGNRTDNETQEVIGDICTGLTETRTYFLHDEITGDDIFNLGDEANLTCSETAVVQDLTEPTLNGNYQTVVNVQCLSQVPGKPTITHTCNCPKDCMPTYESNEPITNSCDRTITRVWKVTDQCDRSQSKTQTINVKDTTEPAFNQAAPTDVTEECADDVPDPPATFPATDTCDGSVPGVLTPTITPGSCPNDYTEVRKWTATDDCDNSVSVTQTITVKDISKPEFKEAPLPIATETKQCAANVSAPAILTATDDCDGPVNVMYTNTMTPTSCPNKYTELREWTAVDDCGNTLYYNQTITVDDTEAPTIMCPDDTTWACNDLTALSAIIEASDTNTSSDWWPTTTDNCDDPFGLPGTPAPEGQTNVTCCPFFNASANDGAGASGIKRTFNVTDECGNLATCDQFITLECESKTQRKLLSKHFDFMGIHDEFSPLF